MRQRNKRRDRLRRWAWALTDATIVTGAVFLAAWFRYDLDLGDIRQRSLLWLAIIACVAQIVFGVLVGPYAVGHERGSFEESSDLIRTVALVAGCLFVAVFLAHVHPVPRSVPFTAPAFAILGMFAARFLIRSVQTRRAAAQDNDRRAIVFGAGEAGRRLTRSLIRDAESGFQPVALLDDDHAKARLRIEGVRVRGTRDDIVRVANKHDADTLIIALPLAEAATIRALAAIGNEAGLEVLTLPPISKIIGGQPTAGDVRGVALSDLLGRRPVRLDTALIAEQIAGKSILVTGAGGSIGSELCRQIARFGPARIYLLDRDESGLQATQLSLTGHGLLNTDEVVLVDIRDLEALRRVFAACQPDIVFHAAALKHLPLLEAFPLEAWKSNVIGTLNVLTAAAEVGVGTFVNISTDKAANPTCVLGYSKRLAERLTAEFARLQPGRYVSVRFGNVLGSRGSVVHAFTAQIERGGPITVTHPDVERFFMLIPEACQLVLQAATIGSDGEVMVLDMGRQVKIVEVARTLIGMSGRTDIDIVYTGLRPGEKLGEELFSESEQRRGTGHSLVSSVEVPAISTTRVTAQTFADPGLAVTWMQSEASTPLPVPDVDLARSGRE